jgi:hypothetical protein
MDGLHVIFVHPPAWFDRSLEVTALRCEMPVLVLDGMELLLPACASQPFAHSLRLSRYPVTSNQMLARGQSNFEVTSSNSIQQSAAPVNQVRTNNEHHAQQVLNANGQRSNRSILYGIRFAVTEMFTVHNQWDIVRS